MAAFNSLFATIYAPKNFAHQHWMFGSTVEYLPDRDASQSLQVKAIWQEGAEGEGRSPGRYSVLLVLTDSIPDKPKRGDGVMRDGRTYDVVDVQVRATGHSRLVLQENVDG